MNQAKWSFLYQDLPFKFKIVPKVESECVCVCAVNTRLRTDTLNNNTKCPQGLKPFQVNSPPSPIILTNSSAKCADWKWNEVINKFCCSQNPHELVCLHASCHGTFILQKETRKLPKKITIHSSNQDRNADLLVSVTEKGRGSVGALNWAKLCQSCFGSVHLNSSIFPCSIWKNRWLFKRFRNMQNKARESVCLTLPAVQCSDRPVCSPWPNLISSLCLLKGFGFVNQPINTIDRYPGWAQPINIRVRKSVQNPRGERVGRTLTSLGLYPSCSHTLSHLLNNESKLNFHQAVVSTNNIVQVVYHLPGSIGSKVFGMDRWATWRRLEANWKKPRWLSSFSLG